MYKFFRCILYEHQNIHRIIPSDIPTHARNSSCLKLQEIQAIFAIFSCSFILSRSQYFVERIACFYQKNQGQIKNKYISLPRNRYNVFSIYLQCLQLSSYKYFILTIQTTSSNTICPIEKICFSYYLK